MEIVQHYEQGNEIPVSNQNVKRFYTAEKE
jgi:hypothetical protein